MNKSGQPRNSRRLQSAHWCRSAFAPSHGMWYFSENCSAVVAAGNLGRWDGKMKYEDGQTVVLGGHCEG